MEAKQLKLHYLREAVIYVLAEFVGHSGDFGNAAKMVGKMSKSVIKLISIGF